MKGSSESKLGKVIKKEEKILEGEFKKEEKALSWFARSLTFKLLLLFIIFLAIIFSLGFLAKGQMVVHVDTSEISAPIINLAPQSSGILEKVFVKEGQSVSADMVVAQVSGVPIRAQIDGIVISVQNTPGQIFNSQTPVVQMIDPSELRVIGHLEENKGLSDIKSGQRVVFTVDAFGSKQFNGIVEEVSPTSRSSVVAFSISSTRPEKQFDIKVIYGSSEHPELKNGMSAKMTIYK